MFNGIIENDYDAELEAEELREKSERGRQAKVVKEFLENFLLEERAQTLQILETSGFKTSEALMQPVLYLRVLRKLEGRLQTLIDIGEQAEKELNEDAREEDIRN